MQLKGARLILEATIVDDILSIAVLSLVTTIVRNRNNDDRDYKYRISSLKDIRIILCIACRRCCTCCVNSFFETKQVYESRYRNDIGWRGWTYCGSGGNNIRCFNI